MSKLQKTLAGGVAALTLAAGVIAASSPAEAQWRRGYHRGGWGAPVAAGVIGGLALGALAAQPRYHYPSYGYGYGYQPVYPAYSYGCFRERRPAYDRWGNFAGYRLVRVCR